MAPRGMGSPNGWPLEGGGGVARLQVHVKLQGRLRPQVCRGVSGPICFCKGDPGPRACRTMNLHGAVVPPSRSRANGYFLGKGVRVCKSFSDLCLYKWGFGRDFPYLATAVFPPEEGVGAARLWLTVNVRNGLLLPVVRRAICTKQGFTRKRPSVPP